MYYFGVGTTTQLFLVISDEWFWKKSCWTNTIVKDMQNMSGALWMISSINALVASNLLSSPGAS